MARLDKKTGLDKCVLARRFIGVVGLIVVDEASLMEHVFSHVHGVAAIGKVESALLLLLLLLAKPKAAFALLGCVHVDRFFFIREVLSNDIKSLHVYLLVDVILAIVDLLHSPCFFNVESEFVHNLVGRYFRGLLVHVAYFQYILQSVQSNLDDLVVWASE